MKKYLLITTALAMVATAEAKDKLEGFHIGAQIGSSKPTADRTALYQGNNAGALLNNEMRWGLHGGISTGYQGYINPDLLGGVILSGSMEKTEQKIGISDPMKINRQYNVNLLGKLGYKATKSVVPYILAGPSFARFKFKDADNSKKKSSWGVSGGVGSEYAYDDYLSYNVQYLYTNYGKTKVREEDGELFSPESYHSVTVGLKYTF